MAVRENVSLESGIINDMAIFSIDNSFRYLHIPVRKHQVVSRENILWRTGEGKIWVNEGIFEDSNLSWMNSTIIGSFPTVYTVDYSKKGPVIGGQGPSNWHLYIGIKPVEMGLEKHGKFKISIEKVVQSPF